MILWRHLHLWVGVWVVGWMGGSVGQWVGSGQEIISSEGFMKQKSYESSTLNIELEPRISLSLFSSQKVYV